MLISFDQSTIANMTAALEYVCKTIRADKDTHELRKLLGDAMIRSSRELAGLIALVGKSLVVIA